MNNVKPFPVQPITDPHAERIVDVVITGWDRFRFGPRLGGQHKLVLKCKLLSDNIGEEICAFYRLSRFDKRGRCWAGKRSNIVRDFGRLLPDYVDEMPLPLSRLKDVQARAKTTCVQTAADGEPLAEQQRYERIKCFVSAH